MRADHLRDNRQLRAGGSSMLPFIMPGSLLCLKSAVGNSINVDDVVCYPDSRGTIVAHRAIGNDQGARIVYTRGDAQSAIEQIPASAIAYLVTRVEHPLLSYDTDSPLGRFFAWSALEHPGMTRAAAMLMRHAARVRAAVRGVTRARTARART